MRDALAQLAISGLIASCDDDYASGDRRGVAHRVCEGDRGAPPYRARRGRRRDLAQDALLAALERWPESGVPDNPGAWLMATAKHRAIDHARRGAMLERKHDMIGYELEAQQEATVRDLDAAIDHHVDEWLRPALCEDALRVGRVLAELAPREPEVHWSEQPL